MNASYSVAGRAARRGAGPRWRLGWSRPGTGFAPGDGMFVMTSSPSSV
jgi:hypothetical protein